MTQLATSADVRQAVQALSIRLGLAGAFVTGLIVVVLASR